MCVARLTIEALTRSALGYRYTLLPRGWGGGGSFLECTCACAMWTIYMYTERAKSSVWCCGGALRSWFDWRIFCGNRVKLILYPRRATLPSLLLLSDKRRGIGCSGVVWTKPADPVINCKWRYRLRWAWKYDSVNICLADCSGVYDIRVHVGYAIPQLNVMQFYIQRGIQWSCSLKYCIKLIKLQMSGCNCEGISIEKVIYLWFTDYINVKRHGVRSRLAIFDKSVYPCRNSWSLIMVVEIIKLEVALHVTLWFLFMHC